MGSSLFTHLADAAVRGSIFCLAVWLVCRLFQRLPADGKCWLWRSVSVKFLVGMGIAVALPVVVTQSPTNHGPVSRATHAILGSLPPVPRPHMTVAQSIYAPPVPAARHLSATVVMLVLWMAGMLFVLWLDLRSAGRLRKRLRGAQETALPDATLAGRVSSVRIRCVRELGSPALVGALKPTVLLPAEYENASEEALSAALAHELAHVKRRDLLWVLVAELVKAIFWFDPFAWIAAREQRTEAEIAADRLAQSWTQETPKSYAEHLLEWIDSPGLRPSPGMLQSTHELKRRVKAMSRTQYGWRTNLCVGLILSIPILIGFAPIQFVGVGTGKLAHSSWPKFHRDNANLGVDDRTDGGESRNWDFKTGKSVTASPAIADDGTVYIGSEDGNLYALDGATGRKKWAFRATANIQSSAAVGADGTVYVGSWDGKLYAVDGATGKQKWAFQTDDGVYASPTVGANGLVYVGSEDYNFYALDAITGVKRWRFKTGNIVCSCAAIGPDGTVYVGSNDGNVYALDGQTGANKWSFSTDGEVVSSPALGPDGTLYIGSWDHSLYALDSLTGAKRWSAKTDGPVKSSPSIGPDGTVYVGTLGRDVCAFDGTTGHQKWVFDAGAMVDSTAAVTSDGAVLIGCFNGKLYVLDGATGKQKWAFKAGDSVSSSPAIGPDGTFYVGSYDGKVYRRPIEAAH